MDMKQIKSGNVVKSPEIVLDPTFFLPPDVVDVRVGSMNDPDEEDGVTYDDVVDVDDAIVSDEDLANEDPSVPVDDDGEGAELLPTPQWMNIIDQQVRIAPDGKAVVDVVIELEDVSGATEYDVRITKS